MAETISQDISAQTEITNEEVLAVLRESKVLVPLLLVLGVVFAVASALQAHGGVMAALAVGVTALVLPLLAYIDQKTMRLPNFILGPLAATVAALLVADSVIGGISVSSLLWGVGTGLGMGLLFLVIAIAMSGGLGMGDIKFVVVAGFLLGTKSLTVALFGLIMLPPFIAVAALLPFLVRYTVVKGDEENSLGALGKIKIAYGPFLVLGTLVALFVPASAAFLSVS
jgi:prepilin signal peptidase PulO-like enzyme (type II secretory pathway)